VTDSFNALVSALTPGMVEHIQALHTANDHGDCAACSGYRSIRWPCIQASAARAARTEAAGPEANQPDR
jgi:hypothetical protein